MTPQDELKKADLNLIQIFREHLSVCRALLAGATDPDWQHDLEVEIEDYERKLAEIEARCED